MKTNSRRLNILMNGILVGQLEKTAKGGLIFSYEQQWLNTPGARPISLSLPLVSKLHEGDVVYNYFDNLLPDNTQIRSRIQSKFRIATSHPFDLLAHIGKDCIGALQIVDNTTFKIHHEIKSEIVSSKEIATILSDYQNYPLGMSNNKDFRISLAGAQEKTAFLYHQNNWRRPLVETPTTHIFKLPIGYISHQQLDLSESCENEWLCAKIAEAFGLPVAECDILHFEAVKALAVKRFDRKLSKDKTWLIRLPQEDMCQALSISPDLKYQADGGPGIAEIMNLLLGSLHAEHDRDIFFRSQVLFWLLAAIDGHAKNFSLFIEPEGKYQLAPLYDIISAYPLIAKKQLHKQKIKMAMALRGDNNHYHWHNVQRRHFINAAKNARFSIEKAEAILDEMLEAIPRVIGQVTSQLPPRFPHHISQPIFDGMLLMKERLCRKDK